MGRTNYETLLAALNENNMDAFQSILQRNGLPKVDEYDYNLLLKALDLYKKPIVNILLDNGCNVNKSGTCVPLLHYILIKKKIRWYNVVEKILVRGACVTNVIDNGNTILHMAFSKKISNGVIELLLNRFLKEITADLMNKDGLGCIHIACALGSIDSIKRCLEISDVNAQVSSGSYFSFAGYSPLHFAIVNNRLDVADLLCQNNAEIYAQDRQGSTPIHLALERLDAGMLNVIFQYDKKHKNYVNNDGLTHFMAACAADDSIAEEYLRVADETSTISSEIMMTSQVPEFSHHPFSGYTPLYFATIFCRLKTFQTLLQRGAYCKLKKLFPINVACNMQRGLMFAFIRNHYVVCPTCKRMNYFYKRLACSNAGIAYLASANRDECTNRYCIKWFLIGFFTIITIAIITVIIGVCVDDSPAEKTYEKTSFKIPQIKFN